MGDEKDLEEMVELVEVLNNINYHDCNSCPLHYIDDTTIDDECVQIYKSLPSDMDCEEVRNKKIKEVIRYILERSLKDG